MRMCKFQFLLIAGLLAVGLPAFGVVTRHVSFRPTEVRGAGGTSVIAPVVSNRRAPQGSFVTPPTPKDEPHQKGRVLKGQVVKVVSGDEIWVRPAGGVREVVKLTRIAAPQPGEPYFDFSADFLSGLIFAKKVEVRWSKKDKAGRLIGTVFLPHGAKGQMVELNLTAVTNGAATYVPEGSDDPVAFAQAEKAAREAKRGLWASR